MRRSPGVAWGLSLVLPGAGQLYCGHLLRGAVTLAFFVLSSVAMVWARTRSHGDSADVLVGMALNSAFVLWGFAGVDAYFSAVELNAGFQWPARRNPRVAAALNLTTRGFGYFYAGQSQRGWVFFFLVGALNRAATKAALDAPLQLVFELLTLSVCAATAWDVYCITVGGAPEAAASAPRVRGSRIPTSVPKGVAAAMALSYACVEVWGGCAGLYDNVSQKGATTTVEARGTIYRNPNYGVEMVFPAGWTVQSGEDFDNVVSASMDGAECNVGVRLESRNILQSARGAAEVTAGDLTQGMYPMHQDALEDLDVAGLSGVRLDLSSPATEDDDGYRMRYLYAHHWLRRWIVIRSGADADFTKCEADFQRILQESRLGG